MRKLLIAKYFAKGFDYHFNITEIYEQIRINIF